MRQKASGRHRWPLGLLGFVLVSGTLGMHSGHSVAITAPEGEPEAVANTDPHQVDTLYIPKPSYTASSWSPYLISELYEIRPGDTLLAIATVFNTDVTTLENLNPGIDPEALAPGSELTVVPNFRGVSYVVEEGDTVEDLASRFDMAAIDIVTYNEVGSALEPGAVLLLPGARPRVPSNLVASRSGSSRTEETQVAAAPPTAPAPAPAPPPPPPDPAPIETGGEWVWPVRRILLFSEYGGRADGFHRGLDMAAPHGTPAYAARSGQVTFAGWHGGYGFYVDIDHGDGITTRYAHASELLVSNGQWVEAGEQILLIGSTGRSTGPHLHFEVLVNGNTQDPRNYLP